MNSFIDGDPRNLDLPQTASKSRLGLEETNTSDFVVPVIEEELVVFKEAHPTGTVRLRKVVHENSEMINELLTCENIEIERVPRNVIVDAAPPVRMEGDVTVIPIVEEVLVVTKQLRLKEEVRIARRQSTSNYYQQVALRSEELIVERSNEEDPNNSSKSTFQEER